MKKKRMIMIVAMVLVLVWREDVFAVESGTTQVSLQADWLLELCRRLIGEKTPY